MKRFAIEWLETRRLLSSSLFPAELITPKTHSTGRPAVADFDSDGNPDFIVPGPVANGIVMYRGNGTSGFTSPTTISIGGASTVQFILAADVNGDQLPDVVTANRESDDITVIVNSTGGFLTPVPYAAGDGPQALAAGDFNGDGIVDLACLLAEQFSGSVTTPIRLFEGTGNGAFAPSSFLDVGPGARAIAVGDFNGDGLNDLASADAGNLTVASSAISVLLSSGNMQFAPRVTYSVTHAPTFIASADLNGDGFDDLVTVNGGNSSSPSSGVDKLSVFLGNGSGILSARVDYVAAQVPKCVVIGDVNRDGTLDLVSTNGVFGGELAIFYGAGDGTFSAAQRFRAPDLAQHLYLHDVNADQQPDLGSYYASGSFSQMTTLIGRPGGTFVLPEFFTTFPREARDIVSADLNGDSIEDLATVETNPTATLRVYHGTGTGVFVPSAALGIGTSAPTAVRAEDLNLDGRLDLIATTYSAFPRLSRFYVYISQPDYTFSAQPVVQVAAQLQGISIADLNADGWLEIAAANLFSHAITVLPGTPGGGFGAPVDYAAGVFPTSTAVGDFNGDSRLDLASAGTGTPTVSVILGHPQGTFGEVITIPVGSPSQAIASADLNGDGLDDLAVSHFGTETAPGSSVSVIMADKQAAFRLPVAVGVGQRPYALALRDLDNDSHVDIVTSFTAVAVLRGIGGGEFASPRHFGGGGFSLAVSDVNGDSRADILAAVNAGVHVLKNQTLADISAPQFVGSSLEFEDSLRVRLAFDEPLSASSVQLSDLIVTNLTLGQDFVAESVDITGSGNEIVFTLPTTSFDGFYRFQMPMNSVADVSWNFNDSGLELTGQSVFILAGDANRDRAVNISDFAILAARFNLPGTFSQGDFNYDGVTNISDFAILASKFNTTLPVLSAVEGPAPSNLPKNPSTQATIAPLLSGGPTSVGGGLFAHQAFSRIAPPWSDRPVTDLSEPCAILA